MNNQQPTNPAGDDPTRGLFFGDQVEAETSQAGFKRNLAVVIGINNYDKNQGILPLRTARNDAQRLADILEQQYGYEVDRLFDDVFGDRLRKLLTQDLPAKVTADDRLIFYFAGHGIALDGDDGPTGYLIPQDANAADRETFLSMQTVHQTLTDLPCRHCLILMDCCFSGAFRWSSTRSISAPPEKLYRERYERFMRFPAWQVITSAAYDQEALDSLTGGGFGSREDESRQHSPFALALFDALTGKGDANGDNVLIATELYLYLRDHVEIKAKEQARRHQTPGLWPLNRHDKGEFIFELGEPKLPPAPEPTLKNNPYRGLEAFEEKHADFFRGRDAVITKLTQIVGQQSLTVVLGASGTGKSSLVKAGLIPRFRQQPAWHILPVMRPTKTPLVGLKTALQDGSIPVVPTPPPVSTAPVEQEPVWRRVINRFRPPGETKPVSPLSANGPSLASAIIGWGQQNKGKTLLLVIDQFEELVTLCRSDGEQLAFLSVLGTVMAKLPDQIRVVLTLRSDFEPQLAALMQPYLPVAPTEDINQEQPQIAGQYWQNARYIVLPMSSGDLRRAIEEPASKQALYFEPSSLVDKLIDEVSQTPGALPLLSFTLSEMYIKYVQAYSRGETNDRALAQKYYDELGGVIGSLRQRADQEYKSFDEQEQATMRRVMLRMVVSRVGELARRRVSEAELTYVDKDENQRVTEVIAHLTTARLVVSDQIDEQKYYEPAHDALVNAWERLRRWLAEAEDTWALQHRLSQRATDWATLTDRKTKEAMLWHNDPRLPQLQEELSGRAQLGFLGRMWQTVFPSRQTFKGITWLNRTESEFTQQSIARKGRNLRRSLATTIVIFLVMAILTIYSLGASIIAEENRLEAEAEARISRAGQLAAQSQTVLDHQTTESLLLALESLAMVEDDPANQTASIQALRQALQRAAGLPLVQDTAGAVSSAISPDHQWLVTGSEDGRVQVWSAADLDAPPQDLPGHTEWVNAITFSLDGTQLATASDDGAVLVWSLSNLNQDPIRFVQNDWVWDVIFSPDGQWLITGNDDGKVMRWSLANPGAAPELLGDFDTRVVKVGQQTDGTVLAVGVEDDATAVMLWIIADKTLEIPLEHNELVQGLDISADGQWLAVGYEDGSGRIWAVDDLESEPAPLNLPDGVSTVKFSPQGKWLAIGSIDGTVCVWQVDNLQAVPMILGHGTAISTITFIDEAGLITASQDDEKIRLWWLNSLAADPKVLAGHQDWIWRLAFSPDGQWLATGSEDATVRLWPSQMFYASFEAEPQILKGHTNWVTALAFSPDGQWLVTGDRDGNLHLRTVADPQIIAHAFQTNGLSVFTAAISPDSQWLATGHADGTVSIWSITTPQTMPNQVLASQESAIWDLSFSPDGSWLASASGGTLLLYSLVEPNADYLVLDIDEGWTPAIAFSRDGRYLVAGAGTGEILLWETTDSTAEPIIERAIWSGHQGAVRSIAFSPDDQWLATGSEDDTVRLWAMNNFQAGNISPPEPLLLKHGKDVVTIAYSPNGQWLATGGGENLARLWLTDISTLKDVACQYADRNFTQVEWEEYFPDEEYRQTCADLPIHPSVINAE